MRSPLSTRLRDVLAVRDFDLLLTSLFDLDELEERCRTSLPELLDDLAFLLRGAPAVLPAEGAVLHPCGARLDRSVVGLLETTLDAIREVIEADPAQLFPLLYNELYWHDAEELAAHPGTGEGDGPTVASGHQLWRLVEHWRARFEARPHAYWLRALRPPALPCGAALGWRLPGCAPRLSPDGTHLLVTQPRETHLLEVPSGRLVRSFPAVAYGAGAGFSPDGARLVAFDGKVANVWAVDPLASAPLATFTSGNDVHHAVFSRGNEVLFTASLGEIRAWRLADGACVGRSALASEVQGLHPQGDDGVVIHGHTSWALWRYTEDGQVAGCTLASYLPELAVSRSGERVVVLHEQRPKGWTLPDGRPLFEGARVADAVNGIAFHPSGAAFAIARWGAAASLHDPDTGEERGKFPGRSTWQVAFSPTGAFLLTCRDGRSTLWDVASRAAVASPRAGASPSNGGGISWSEDGRLVAIGDASSTLIVDLTTLTPAGVWRDDVPAARWNRCFSASGATLVVTHAHHISFWDTARGTRKLLIEADHLAPVAGRTRLVCRQGDAWIVRSAEDGAVVFSLTVDGAARSWSDPAPVRKVLVDDPHGLILGECEREHGREVIAWSSDDGRVRYRASGALLGRAGTSALLVRAPTGDLSVREAQTGAERVLLPATEGKAFRMSPDERLLAIYGLGDRARAVEVWDLATQTRRHTLVATDNSVSSVQFSADGLTLTTVTSRTMHVSDGYETPTECVFDLATGALLREVVDPPCPTGSPRPELLPGFIQERDTLCVPGGARLPLPRDAIAAVHDGKLCFASTEEGRVTLYQLCGA
jgi:WD40 repeat protein